MIKNMQTVLFTYCSNKVNCPKIKIIKSIFQELNYQINKNKILLLTQPFSNSMI